MDGPRYGCDVEKSTLNHTEPVNDILHQDTAMQSKSTKINHTKTKSQSHATWRTSQNGLEDWSKTSAILAFPTMATSRNFLPESSRTWRDVRMGITITRMHTNANLEFNQHRGKDVDCGTGHISTFMNRSSNTRRAWHTWMAFTAFPLVAGTFGPFSTALNICALAEPWRIDFRGNDNRTWKFVDDPHW